MFEYLREVWYLCWQAITSLVKLQICRLSWVLTALIHKNICFSAVIICSGHKSACFVINFV